VRECQCIQVCEFREKVCLEKFIIGFARSKPTVVIRGLTEHYYTKGHFALSTPLFFLYLLLLYDMWYILAKFSCFKLF